VHLLLAPWLRMLKPGRRFAVYRLREGGDKSFSGG
jgi:hypothetical protein